MNGYRDIVKHYEACFRKYGDTSKGVDWPNEQDALLRYQIMMDVIRKRNPSVLDFGCGSGRLYQYILDCRYSAKYIGVDASPVFVEFCQKKYPGVPFYCLDILSHEAKDFPHADYIIMNGVFTEKVNLSFEDMEAYFHELLKKVYEIANEGIAFNVMSKAVDWERDDLFHMPTDRLIDFMVKHLSRHFVIRNDYGLYEYTVYLYKKSTKEVGQ